MTAATTTLNHYAALADDEVFYCNDRFVMVGDRVVLLGDEKEFRVERITPMPESGVLVSGRVAGALHVAIFPKAITFP